MYADWEVELRKFMARMGADPSAIERVEARYNHKEDRFTLYFLANSSDGGR